MYKTFGLLFVLGFLTGCNASGRTPPKVGAAVDEYYFGQYDLARQKIEHKATKTNEDFALNNVRLGSIALAQYDMRTAESAFFNAYEVMNSTGVNKGGRDVAATLVLEKMKIWKGEPFERAMCNFYLGLIYYMRQDYANARAAMENALFKLRDYGKGKAKDDKYQEVESDFLIGYIMLAKAWQKLGDETKANEMFDRAAQLRPDLKPLVEMHRRGGNNVLLIVDFGQGPQKILQGDNSIVNFAPHPSQSPPIPRPVVSVDGRTAGELRGMTSPPMDMIVMAHNAQWQSIDTIRLTKSIAGTGLMAAGAYEAGRSDNHANQAAGLGMIAAGALLKAGATGDVRHWEMLPRTVFILPLALPPGRHNVTVSFGAGPVLARTINGVEAPAQGETTCYLHMPRVNLPPIEMSPAADAPTAPPANAPAPAAAPKPKSGFTYEP